MSTKTDFIVSDSIEISALANHVWEVLTNPDFIKQWDEIPENYSGGALKMGSVIEWEGYSRLTVVTYEAARLLKLQMFLPKVNLDPKVYNVSYRYALSSANNTTLLTITIGDFAPLPNAQQYFDTTLEWVGTMKIKIKELAESLGKL